MHTELPPSPTPSARRSHVALLVSTFTIAVCGLVYELLAGTVSSYLLGDSVYQFSIVIGLFMAAMGIGSYLSRFVAERLCEVFVWAQIAIAVIGGTSAMVLFFAFSHFENYAALLVVLCVTIGTLVGLEIPLVIRLLREHQVLKLNVSNVLTADYIGALAASLLFPLLLVPRLGLLRTGLLFGLLNAAVAAMALYTFRSRFVQPHRTGFVLIVVVAGLIAAFAGTDRITGVINARLYSGEIIHAETTPYQNIVVTRSRGVVSLFINGALQFNSLDEYRYHEALVHPAMSLARHQAQVLILGGGDGLAAREVLKYPEVQNITLVDLDPAITELFSHNAMLRRLNHNALTDPRVEVINADAAKFLESTTQLFDVVLIDLPDPHDVGISRLYTRWFYGLVRARLAAQGIIVTQATSPFFAREAFWSIERTLATAPDQPRRPGGNGDASGLRTVAYHAYVPTFGDWGFVLAARHSVAFSDIELRVPTRFLEPKTIETLTQFPPDMARTEVEANTLDDHPLPGYYQRGWERWYE